MRPPPQKFPQNDVGHTQDEDVPHSVKIEVGHVPQGAPDDEKDEVGAHDESGSEDGRWRIESKGEGRFCLRCGSHSKRETLAGVYIKLDDLKPERREQYERNKETQRRHKEAK